MSRGLLKWRHGRLGKALRPHPRRISLESARSLLLTASKLRRDTVNQVHSLVDYRIYSPNYKGSNDGSYHYHDRAVGQFFLGWPRNLINELVIRFLDIRKYFIFFHFSS